MTSKQKQVDIKQRFAALQQRFIGTLTAKADRLSRLVKAIAQGELAFLTEVIADSHQLAGSCGTFGQKALGDLASHIEQSAIALQNSVPQSDRALQLLIELTELFQRNVASVIDTGLNMPVVKQAAEQENNLIWLLLNDALLTHDLSRQLSAFGYSIEVFTDFSACCQALDSTSPALIYSAVELDASDGSVFKQTDLLKAMQEKQIPWMLYSPSDDFDLRILAARHQAQAFYVSPLDIPSMLGRITELMQLKSEQKGRVCVMDDDALLAEHYALALQAAGIECMVLADPRQLIQDILHFQPELILMDLHMPLYSGPELAGVIRQHDALKSLPIVYLSAERDQTQQLKAMAFGADDFMTKPIDDAQLVKAVQVRLARSRELRNLIEKDSLTGLIKHSAIKEVAQLEFERAKRSGKNVSVVMLDIDHFKSVNDKYGHAIGDVVITTLATMLQQRIRRTDKAGRYGGEEFLLVLPNCGRQDAMPMLETILESFRCIVFHAAGEDFYCTFSAGVACSDADYADAEAMLAAADERLYQAKSLGRNRVLA
ncbi:diguanylate cyclase [Alkalimonas sp.]|uniref:diguanylate cyclase n=1 Tax=Alkalimonas sp. TaxID=1872453 RepID=UPI002A233456|nr:diguanylate cyclase [Alkalimonas sp.]